MTLCCQMKKKMNYAREYTMTDYFDERLNKKLSVILIY